MSRNGNLIALALGLGGGALAWHVTRDAKPKAKPATAPSTGGPPRNAAPCPLKLDAAGLTADGAAADVPAAVARCKDHGGAALVVAGDAPAGALAQLVAALQVAGVPFVQRVA